MNLQVPFGNFGPYKLLAVLLQCTSAHMYSIMEIHLAKKMTKTSLQYAKTIQALYFSHKKESALHTNHSTLLSLLRVYLQLNMCA